MAQAPTVPQTPNKINRLIALFLGLSLGLVIGLGSVFVSELLRETFVTPNELEKFTGYSVLATLPLQRSKPPQAW